MSVLGSLLENILLEIWKYNKCVVGGNIFHLNTESERSSYHVYQKNILIEICKSSKCVVGRNIFKSLRVLEIFRSSQDDLALIVATLLDF